MRPKADNPLKCPNTNAEVIDVVLGIGEELSGTNLLPYQRGFAERIVDSTIKGDANTVTGLFARQCVVEDTMIPTPSGPRMIKHMKAGDKILSHYDGRLIVDTVKEVWPTHKQAGYKIKFATGDSLIVSENHQLKIMKRQKDGNKFFVTPTDWVDNYNIEKPFLSPTDVNADISDAVVLRSLLTLCFSTKQGKVAALLSKAENYAMLVDYKTAQRFASVLGLDDTFIRETSKSFDLPFQEASNKEILQAIFFKRGTFLKYFAWLMRFHKTTKNGQDLFKLRHRYTAEDDKFKRLENLLKLLGIYVTKHEVKNDFPFIQVSLPESMLLLKQHYEDHFFYSAFCTYLNRVSRSAQRVCYADLKQLMMKFPKHKDLIKGFALNLSGGNVHTKVMTHGLGIMKYLQILELCGLTNNPEAYPTSVYVGARKPKYCGDFHMYDMETEHTQQYIADTWVSHNCGKTEALAITLLGLLLWMPALAREYPADPRFKKFSKGLWVGVFAPALRQAKQIFKRVRTRLKTEEGNTFRAELNVHLRVDQTMEVELSNGSKIFPGPAGEGSNIESETCHLVIGDEAQDISSYVWKKSIVPMTTMTAGTKVLIGTANTKKSYFYERIQMAKGVAGETVRNGPNEWENHFEYNYEIPSAITKEYRTSIEEIIAEIGMDSDEFQMAYNNRFIFARGMFCKPESLEFNSDDNPAGLVFNYEMVDTASAMYAGSNDVSVGIDIGKTVDPTVMTAIEIDKSRPIDVLNYITYNKKVISWTEFKGDDIDDQIPKMVLFIHRVKAKTVVIDSTGKGDDYADKLTKALRGTNIKVIRYHFSRQSKDRLFKNLQSDMQTNRIMFPGGEKTRKKKYFFKCMHELSILEKDYIDNYLIVKAPNIRNAHDDYPVSLALAAWGCRNEVIGTVKTTHNRIYQGRKQARCRKNNLLRRR